MDVQDLPQLNALSIELATVLDEISGVGYQRAIKGNEWIKRKHVLSGHYSREPWAESSSSLFASERIKVPGVVIDPVSFDRISGFNILSDTEAVKHTLPLDPFCKLAGFYQFLDETQYQLSDQVALKKVSQFVNHVAPMLSSKDVSALQSILERLNVKSEEQIIHLKYPDSFTDERDDADAEIVWITSEVPDETDEFEAVETSSFVSDTFSITEYVPKKSSDDLDESEIIWITASEELVGIDQSCKKTGITCTAVSKAERTHYDYSYHEEIPNVLLKPPQSSSDQDESEFIWITSPEEVPYPACVKNAVVQSAEEAICKEDLMKTWEEPSTSKLLLTSYKDQSKSYKTTHMKVTSSPATKSPCKLYDFAGEEVIITPFVKRISASDDLPCLTKEPEENHTAAKFVKTSDKDQLSSSSKQRDASSSSSPITVCELDDFSDEEMIITHQNAENHKSHENDWNLSYMPQYPQFVNDYYWRRPPSKTTYEVRKKIVQSCLACDSEPSICDLDKSDKKNKGKTGPKEQLDLKNSLKEVVLRLDHSVDSHEEYLQSPVTDETVDTNKLSEPYINFLRNQHFYSVLKNVPFDSSPNDTSVKVKSTASGKFNILNLEKSSEIDVIHDNGIHLSSSEYAVEDAQHLADQQLTQKDSVSISTPDSTCLESSPENGPSYVFQHHLLKESDKETTALSEGVSKLFVKDNLSHHLPEHVEEHSTNQENKSVDDSEIRPVLQEDGKTIKDSNGYSEMLSSVQPLVCKNFTKPEEPVATKYVQNLQLSDKTPTLENHTKDNSSYVSLHNQQNHSSVSDQRETNLISEEVCDKFHQMPSEEVFPATSLLYSSYGSNGVTEESSSTDEVKKKKSARNWMRKFFIPKKFRKKNVKGIK